MLDAAALLNRAREGALLLTPSLRAARDLRTRLTAVSGTQSAAAAGRVTHWHAFTAELWQDALVCGVDERTLLTSLQERRLWEQVLASPPALAANPANSGFSAEVSPTIVDLCLGAASLVFRHRATAALLRVSSGTPDVLAFAGWFRSFEQLCSNHAWLPGAGLETALADHFWAGHLSVPTDIVLCGFAAPYAAQEQLLEAVRSQGSAVSNAPVVAGSDEPEARILRCADLDDEMGALIDYLYNELQDLHSTKIVVVVPDLSSARDHVERALRDRFVPSGDHALDEVRNPLWEFSTGRSLTLQPCVADALRLLQWTVEDLTSAEISALLRSSGFRWPVSDDGRASLDAGQLRRGSDPLSRDLRGTWSPVTAADRLAARSPQLAGWLRTLAQDWCRQDGRLAGYGDWATHTRSLLRRFGWPGPHVLSSMEFQAVQRWDEALDELAELDQVAAPLDWPDFVSQLFDTVRRTVFAAQNTDAPIQFVTPEEATGIEATHAWLLHADEETWNSSRAPHPLLPYALQRAHRMPGTDPAQDDALFRAAVERVAVMAPHVTFSYAAAGDAGEARPAAHLPAVAAVREVHATAGVVPSLHATVELQPVADEALPLAAVTGNVRGGVRVLQLQSACAFRAFAELRLGSTALEADDLGMDPRERGTLLHAVLGSFWKEVEDSKTLQALMVSGQLDATLQRHIDSALPTATPGGELWSATYRSIQRERLRGLLTRWLQTEAERPPFTVVGIEQEQSITIGGVSLRVKVDRIDEVVIDGVPQRIILDYKTSEQSIKKWLGDRPEEPQLPLYAIGQPTGAGGPPPVGAVAFAVLRPGKGMGLRCMPPDSHLLNTGDKATDASLADDLASWQGVLQTLAHDYLDGANVVAPRDFPSTCRYCDQRLLCRIDPEIAGGMQDAVETDS